MLTDFAADIQRMSTGGFVVVSVIVGIVVLVAFQAIWRNWSRARLIEDTPTARIRSAPQGYVELEGEARLLPGPPIVAPLTGRRCVWYRYRIEHEEHTYDSKGHSRSHWRTVDSGTSEGLFELDDTTGRCVIDPDGAEVHPDDKDVWRGHSRWPSAGPPRRRGGLRFTAGDYRYTEERLLPGPLYAVGWFESIRTADGELKDATAALLRHWKQDQAGLLARFDANGDGHIDAGEWERAWTPRSGGPFRNVPTRPPSPRSICCAGRPLRRRPSFFPPIPRTGLAAATGAGRWAGSRRPLSG